MKKLLAILVLGLILTSCATAPKRAGQQYLVDEGSIKVGMKVSTLSDVLGGAVYYEWIKIEGVWRYIGIVPTVGEAYNSLYYVSEQIVPGKNDNTDNYKVTKIFQDLVDYYDYFIEVLPAGKKKNQYMKWKSQTIASSYYQKTKSGDFTQTSNSTQTKGISSSSLSSSERIAQAKLACTDLGFKPKTEKFADCALKFVTLDFERTTSAKNEPQVVIHKNDVNVWDELGVLFRQQGIIQDTTRPANTRTNMRCTTTKAGYGQVITNCR